MQAIGMRTETGSAELLEEIEVPIPVVGPRDVLIRVVSCAMNPVDTKFRNGRGNPGPLSGVTAPNGASWDPMILGYDCAGTVEAVGEGVSLFKTGDCVYTAGCISAGANAEFVAVDERIVGKAPESVSATAASSVPLTMLTAWEGLEQLGVDMKSKAQQGKRLLILPGAGGVGSVVTQLASKVAGLEVIATGSRPESQAVATELGAAHVITHREPLKPQLTAAGIDGVDYIYDAYSMEAYMEQYADVIKPYGKIVSITNANCNFGLLKSKCVSFSWEFMFARSLHGVDMEKQHDILTEAAALIDRGTLTPSNITVLPWSVDSMQQAHLMQETGKTIGKIVISREAQ